MKERAAGGRPRVPGLVALLALVPGCLLVDAFDGTYVVSVTGPTCNGRWSHVYGGPKAEEAGAIVGAGDSSTTLYVVGSFAGSLELGGASLEANGVDSYVGVFDGDGNALRSAASGRKGNDRARAAAVTGDTLVVAGVFDGGSDGCAPTDSAATAGIFVSFVDALSLQVSKLRCIRVEGAAVEVAGVAIDGDEVRVVGSFDGELTVDGLTLSAPDTDGFVLSFDATTGDSTDPPVAIGGAGETVATGVAALTSGGFVVVGGFDGTFGLDAAVSGSDPDAFAAFFDATATLSFVRVWQGDGDQQATAVLANASHVFVAGELDERGAIAFGGTASALAPPDRVLGFVAALPFDGVTPELGAASWIAAFDADDLDVNALGLTDRAAYVAGLASGGLAVAGGAPSGAAENDMFALRLDLTTGAVSGTSRCGGADQQAIVGLATNVEDDDVFFVGSLRGAVDLGALQRHASHGESDILIGELATPE